MCRESHGLTCLNLSFRRWTKLWLCEVDFYIPEDREWNLKRTAIEPNLFQMDPEATISWKTPWKERTPWWELGSTLKFAMVSFFISNPNRHAVYHFEWVLRIIKTETVASGVNSVVKFQDLFQNLKAYSTSCLWNTASPMLGFHSHLRSVEGLQRGRWGWGKAKKRCVCLQLTWLMC